MKQLAYKQWKNAFKLENDFFELIAVTDVGPRILHLSLKNGENIFHEIDYTKEQLSENVWRNYGGHRLWIAPEDKLITYQPDNATVKFEIFPDKIKLLQNEDPVTKTVKELEIKIHESKPYAEITHRITNVGNDEIEISAWALSVLKMEGKASIPLGKKGFHPQDLLPNYSINLWAYTQLNDPCWKIDSDYIALEKKGTCNFPQKIGTSGETGWAIYELGDTVFLKAFHQNPTEIYPDKNSAVEIFSNGRFIEIETLSPLKKLKKKESVENKEYWALQKKDLKNQDREAFSKLRLDLVNSF